MAAWILLSGASAGAVEVPFAATGAEQPWPVPAGVTRIHVVAIGGSGGLDGGRGAIATADLGVVPGSTLYVNVGGSAAAAQGGFNGGGDSGGLNAGGGGGASDVRSLSRTAVDAQASLDSRLIVAGGGGGRGETRSELHEMGANVYFGGAGAAAGAQGGGCTAGSTATGGGPGGATMGGGGGERGGEQGQKGAGGKGALAIARGGGGGGGLYGGGGGGEAAVPLSPAGCGAGGGGGSSGFAAGALNTSVVVPSAGVAPPPAVTITYTVAPDPPVTTVPDAGSPPLASPTGSPQPPAADVVAPALTRLAMSPASFVARRGATVAYRLSEAARVRFGVLRGVPGVRSRGRCLPLRGTPRAGAKRCTAYRVVKGSFSDVGEAGANRVRFTGRLRGRSLAPGAYRLVAVAVDAAGNRSLAGQRTFRVVPS